MMKRLNKLVLSISFLYLIISFTAGCGMGKEAEIKKSFEKTLSMYPIKNLEDLYDKEGYRDDQFDKRIKGRGLFVLKWQFRKRRSLKYKRYGFEVK